MSAAAVILIGNSDDRLSQRAWHDFCKHVAAAVDKARGRGAQVQFFGASCSVGRWQSAAWAVSLPDDDSSVRDDLRGALHVLCAEFRQDSIAWVEAEPEFLGPVPARPGAGG